MSLVVLKSSRQTVTAESRFTEPSRQQLPRHALTFLENNFRLWGLIIWCTSVRRPADSACSGYRDSTHTRQRQFVGLSWSTVETVEDKPWSKVRLKPYPHWSENSWASAELRLKQLRISRGQKCGWNHTNQLRGVLRMLTAFQPRT